MGKKPERTPREQAAHAALATIGMVAVLRDQCNLKTGERPSASACNDMADLVARIMQSCAEGERLQSQFDDFRLVTPSATCAFDEALATARSTISAIIGAIDLDRSALLKWLNDSFRVATFPDVAITPAAICEHWDRVRQAILTVRGCDARSVKHIINRMGVEVAKAGHKKPRAMHPSKERKPNSARRSERGKQIQRRRAFAVKEAAKGTPSPEIAAQWNFKEGDDVSAETIRKDLSRESKLNREV